MKVTCLEVGLAAGVAACFAVCWMPSVLFFGWERGDNAINANIPGLGNSSCDYTLAINLSVVLANAPPQIRHFLIGSVGGRDVLHLNAVQLRTAYSILGTDQFPLPENQTLTPEQLLLLSSTALQSTSLSENVTCNTDMTVDEERGCCYFSCKSWKWFDNSLTVADDVFFGINLILGVTSLFLTTVLTVKAQSERKFPLLTTAWYILICTVAPTLVETAGRLVGRNTAICCGKDDLFQVLDENNCFYTIFFGVVERWLYLAAVLWLSCGFIDLWFILALLKGDVFDRWSNHIHFAQFIGVWTLSGLITLIPLFAEGTGSYSNPFLTFASFGANGDLGYYFTTLPLQLALAPLGLLLPHLVYTLRKRSIQRKALMTEGMRSDIHVRQLKDVERRFLYLSISLFVITVFLLINYLIDFAVNRSIDFDKAVVEYVTCAMLNQKTNCDKVPALQGLLYASITLQRTAILASLLSITYYLSFDRNVRAVWNKWCRRGARSGIPATASVENLADISSNSGSSKRNNISETTKL